MPPQTAQVAAQRDPTRGSVIKTKAQIININDLIIHKYTEGDVLRKKAGQLALSIINEELRQGEYLRTTQPGVYHLYFPMLRDDAAQLRCAVLGERIFRAIRDLNPAAKFQKAIATTRAPDKSEVQSAGSTDPAHRIQADHAMRLMTASWASRDELATSDVGQFLLENAAVSFHPCFYAEKNVITGHMADLMLGGSRLTPDAPELTRFGRSRDEVAATIDLFCYRQAVAALERNVQRGLSNLVICPVNISTVLRARFRAAFLEEEVPTTAKELLVFRVRTFAPPFSRMKALDTAGYLRSRCRALAADVTVGAGDFSVFKQAGFHFLGIEAPDTQGRSLIAKHGAGLTELAKKAGLRTFVTNVSNRESVSAALQVGFSYICGPWFADD
jgi:hypothetical protein